MKKVVKILVEKANVNAITSANRTLLMYAARYGQIEVTWWLQMITIMECLTQVYYTFSLVLLHNPVGC